MALAGQLELQLVADVARLRADMDRMQGVVSRGAAHMQKALDDVRGALSGLFGGASAAGFAMWIKSAVDFQDQLNDLNKTTNISIERLAGLSLMSKQTGSDLTGIAQAMNKLTLEMGKAPEKFAKIGISAKDPLEAFKQMSDLFREIQDPQLRAAVAAEALGKAWASSAPALAEGSKQIEEMVKRGEELAGITAADAKAADEFNDRVSELQIALTGMASGLARDMLPMLTALVQSLTDVTHETKNSDAGFSILTETLRAVVVFGGNVAFVVRGIAREIGGLAAQIAALLSDDYSRFAKRPGQFANPLARIREEMVADAQRDRAAFDAWEQRMMSAGRATEGMSEAQRELQREMNRMQGAAKTASEAALRGFVDGDAAAKKAADAAKKAASEKKKALEEQTKRDLDALEEQEKIQAEVNKLLNDEQAARAKQITDATKMVESIEFETKALTMTNAERETAIALRELENSGVKQGTELYEEFAKKIKEAVEQREAIKEHQKIWESIDRTAHDVFTNIFEGGSNVFKKLGQTLKAALLDLLYQMTIRPWIIQIGASLGVPGAGMAAQALGGGGGGALGMLGNIGSLFGVGGLGGSLAAGAGWLTGATTLGGALGAAGSLIGTGTAGGIMSGIGMGLGALGPIGLGIGAISMLAGSGKRGGPKVESGFGFGVPGRGDPSAARAQVEAIQQAYANLVGLAGGTNRGLSVGMFSAMDPAGTAMTQLALNGALGGQQFYSRRGFENVPRGEEALKAAMAEEVNRVLLGALQRSDVPGALGDWLRSLGDASKMAAKGVEEAVARLQKAGAERQALDDRWFQMTATQTQQVARLRQRELDALDLTNRAQLVRIHALEDEMAKQQLAQSVFADASSAIADLKLNLGAYVDRLNATPAGLLPPEQQLANAKAQFAIQLAMAKSGDRNAMQGITGYADQLIAAQTAYTASGTATADTISYVKQALTDLPALLSAEQIVAQSVQDGSMLLNASMQELIARADANSAAQVAAINGQLAAQNTAAAAAAAAAPAVGMPTREMFGGGLGGTLRYTTALAAWRAANGQAPGFASGGDYSGGYVHWAGERGPELRAGGPARYFSAEQSARAVMGVSDGLQREVQGLRQDVARLTAVVASYAQRDLATGAQVAENTAQGAEQSRRANAQRPRVVIA